MTAMSGPVDVHQSPYDPLAETPDALFLRSTEPEALSPPNYGDILAAAERLEGVGVYTPLVTNRLLDKAVGGRVFVKAECFQHTGTFKFRGAYNRIAKLSDVSRQAGIVAFSSGNHAQGVAYAAQLFGVPAVIVMPHDAPAVKRNGALRLGAEVVGYDRARESREAMAVDLAEARGGALTPAYDHRDIIAGQGTVGLEAARQMAAAGVQIDQVVCCVGGGGLMAGIATALSQEAPSARLYAAEPVGFDDHRRALLAGARRPAPGVRLGLSSACDALLAPAPGQVTWQVNGQRLAGGVAVSDAMAFAAMRFAFASMKLVLEPGGAVALAAMLAGLIDGRGQNTVVIASGGNVDPNLFARVVSPAS